MLGLYTLAGVRIPDAHSDAEWFHWLSTPKFSECPPIGSGLRIFRSTWNISWYRYW